MHSGIEVYIGDVIKRLRDNEGIVAHARYCFDEYGNIISITLEFEKERLQ